MNKANKYSPDVRECAVRLVQEHSSEYPSSLAAIESSAPKIGCSANTLHEWVRREQVDTGQRDGVGYCAWHVLGFTHGCTNPAGHAGLYQLCHRARSQWPGAFSDDVYHRDTATERLASR